MSESLDIVVLDRGSDLAVDVAARLTLTLSKIIEARGSASIALTGGSILEQCFAAIADHPDSRLVDWSVVDVYWGDERFVASDSDDRNDLQVRRLLVDKLPFLSHRIHPMPATDGPDGDDVDAAVGRYEAELPPSIDIVLLGMGPDGHCASLFPNHPGVFVSGQRVTAVRDSPKPPPTRTSLTFDGLATANEIWVIASGAEKADAVLQGLGGADRAQVPIAGARARFRTSWLLDRGAAGRLPTYHR